MSNTFIVLAVENEDGDFLPMLAIANIAFLNPLKSIVQAYIDDAIRQHISQQHGKGMMLHAEILHLQNIDDVVCGGIGGDAIITKDAIELHKQGKTHIEN